MNHLIRAGVVLTLVLFMGCTPVADAGGLAVAMPVRRAAVQGPGLPAWSQLAPLLVDFGVRLGREGLLRLECTPPAAPGPGLFGQLLGVVIGLVACMAGEPSPETRPPFPLVEDLWVAPEPYVIPAGLRLQLDAAEAGR